MKNLFRTFLGLGLLLFSVAMIVDPSLFSLVIDNPEVALAAGGYIPINVVKPAKDAGVSNNTDKITIFDWNDVVSGYQRDAKGVVIPGSLVLKSGAYMIQYYSTRTKTSPSMANEGDADSVSFKHNVDTMHPGDSKDILELIQNWTNANAGVIVEKCSGGSTRLYGDPCHPLQLKATGQDDGLRGQQLLWEGVGTISKVPAIYEGNLTLESPLAIVAADDTTPSVALGAGQYQLSENTAATEVSTLDDAEHEEIYSLLGSGGANTSSITSAGDFALKDGITWNANAGSQITFKAFKTGANSFVFIELSRA
jgi:hypothetical protein